MDFMHRIKNKSVNNIFVFASTKILYAIICIAILLILYLKT